MIYSSLLINLLGAKSVGNSAVLAFIVVTLPFVLLTVLGASHVNQRNLLRRRNQHRALHTAVRTALGLLGANPPDPAAAEAVLREALRPIG